MRAVGGERDPPARRRRLADREVKACLGRRPAVVDHARVGVDRVGAVADAGDRRDHVGRPIDAADHLVRLVGDQQVAVCVEHDRDRQVQRRHVGGAAVTPEPTLAGAAHVDQGAGGEVDLLDAAVVPGGDPHLVRRSHRIERDVGRVIQPARRRIVGGEAQLADAGDDPHRPVRVDHANPVVVPVDDVEQSVGADRRVLRQVKARFARRQAVGAVTGDPGPRDRADLAGRAERARGRHRVRRLRRAPCHRRNPRPAPRQECPM